jgi:hypothetical protein
MQLNNSQFLHSATTTKSLLHVKELAKMQTKTYIHRKFAIDSCSLMAARPQLICYCSPRQHPVVLRIHVLCCFFLSIGNMILMQTARNGQEVCTRMRNHEYGRAYMMIDLIRFVHSRTMMIDRRGSGLVHEFKRRTICILVFRQQITPDVLHMEHIIQEFLQT